MEINRAGKIRHFAICHYLLLEVVTLQEMV